ncbi:MAG: hypothetical protein CMI36_05175 [Owenweeksia sp.]|nr:hypothetical protein [Owenweeksia sp.]MBF98363.1 hypothetical protein [Owenweeksia sp.]HBF21464.1 hypothetical protein [Cryomorphaceae bacterium]HCQ14947.1 hypothetical protein [Cryomorphaceae bacterium]
MNKWTPYQKKFYLLAGGLFLLLILSYQFSISRTVEELTTYRDYKAKNALIANLGNEMKTWSERNRKLDEQLGGEYFTQGFQESLLHEVGSFCNRNRLKLAEFSEPFEGEDGDYRVETIVLTIEGDYKPLLKLMHHLETGFKGGRIASAEFLKEENFKSHREELFLKLYVQKIKKKEDEDK